MSYDTWSRSCRRLGLTGLVLAVGVIGAGGNAAGLSQAREAVTPMLDAGGFSVDFRDVGRTHVTGPNLLVNGNMEEVDADGMPTGWETDSYVWLPHSDPAREREIHERIRPQMRWKSCGSEPCAGKSALHLSIPRAAYDARDPAGHEFCAYCRQSLALPPLSNIVRYVLSWHHRGWSAADVPNSRPYARVTFFDAAPPGQGKQTRVYAQKIFQSTGQWRTGQLEFVVPKATRRLDVRLALAGCGEVRFDNVTLRRTEVMENGPTVRLMPGHFLDNLYCLSAGDPGVMTFGFRNEANAPIGRPQLVLQLPAGVDILDLHADAKLMDERPVRLNGTEAQQYRIDIGAWKGRIRDGTFRYPYNMWQGLTLLLTSSKSAGDARYAARYWLEDGEYSSKPLSFAIRIVPKIPVAKAPRLFKTGAVLFLVNRFATEPGVEAFAGLYKAVGFNAVHCPPSPLGAEFGRLGLERYAQPFANGYRMGNRKPGDKPEEAVFRLVDGKPRWEAICPVEVYERGEYFRTRIENDIVRRILVTERQAEQIMANWEPFMYNGKGCFCDRCREEFRAYSKLPAAEFERVWPKAVVSDHGDIWTKFRSWQHGKLMATLEQTVNAVGREAGLDSHFIPEIHYSLLTSSWDRHPHNREFAAVDYLGKLPVLESWAPYNWYVFGSGPYDYVRGLHLTCHATAREVQGFLEARLPAGERPDLIAFPYGTYEGATQPEALAFEILTYLFNGYAGAFAYLFPGGYDARYWRALANMNSFVAAVEPFVRRGRPVEKHHIEPATPLPRPDPRFLSSGGCARDIGKRWKDLPLLLSWEFELGATRLIAVGNFWERGECFFRLIPRELDGTLKYVLRDPTAQRVYADRDGNRALSAEELGRGMLLHAGAMRYSVFVLEPYREGTDYGDAVRPRAIETAMRERLPGIKERWRNR